MKLHRRSIARLLCLAPLALATASAVAQDYPERPVVIVAASAPGGGFDLMGRIMAETLTKSFGKSFVVENRTGAGTLIGTQSVAAAPPDGYTLLVGSVSNLVFNAALYKSPKYDARKDFTTIGLLASNPYVLIARADLPVNSYKELIDYARANPDKLAIATGGAGSGQHIMAAALVNATGIKLNRIPYQGAQAAYTDLLGGRIDLFIDSLPTVRPQVEARRVKAFFTTGDHRAKSMPDVPTVKEVGLPALEIGSWFGLFAPSRTPAPIVERLRTALAAAAKDPDLRVRIEKTGMDALSLTLPQADALIKSDYDRWTAFIKKTGIALD